MPLAIQPEHHAGSMIVYAIGRITLGRECQQLQEQLTELVDAGEKDVVVNLRGVTYIDSTGIGVLAMVAGLLRKAGGRLRLTAARGQVEEVLRVTRLYDMVARYPESAAAAA